MAAGRRPPFGFGAEGWDTGIREADSLGPVVLQEVERFGGGFVGHGGRKQGANEAGGR